MTYPPQQPGPYGQQDPYGQQPYGQQPYGQPQYGAPQWGQPAYPAGPPPKKSRGGLIATLVIVAVLVIGGGGLAAFLLLKDDGGNSADGGDGGGSPRSAADQFTRTLGTVLSNKVEDVDLAPLEPLSCKEDYRQLTDELEEAREDGKNAESEKIAFGVTNFKETNEGATFDMTQKQDDKEADPIPMSVLKEDGDWVVCGLYEDSGPDQDDPTSEGPTSGGGESGGGSIPNPIPKTS